MERSAGFHPLARARSPSEGKISASAALSASARRTPRCARLDSARTRTRRPRIAAAMRASRQPRLQIIRIWAPIPACTSSASAAPIGGSVRAYADHTLS